MSPKNWQLNLRKPMTLLSFSMFIEKVESGEKTQTIRSARKYPIKAEDVLDIWWKSRRPERRKLGRTPCLRVTPIVLGEDFAQTPNTKITVPEFLKKFAKLDGFDSWAEMKDYFRPKFGEELHLIEWQYPFNNHEH